LFVRVWLAAWALTSGEILAQPAGPTPVQPAAAELSLSGQLDLARLLDLSAKQLNVAIDYDPTLKQQTLTLRPAAGGALNNAGLWSLTNRALQQKGLTTIVAAGGSGFTVVKIEEAPRLARVEEAVTVSPTSPSAGSGPWVPSAGFRNAVIQLQYLSAKDAAEALKPLFARGGGGGGSAGGATASSATNITPLGGDTRLLLISDLSTRIDEALTVLRRLDVPEKETVTAEIAVRNVSPAQAAASVAQMVLKRDAVAGEKLVGEIIAAPSNSTVLILSPKRLIPVWMALVEQADRREPVETVAYTPKVFAVKDVANLVQQVAGGVAVAGGAAVDERFKTVVEEPTGTLLVTATAAQHKKIEELMTRLDSVPGEARRPMRVFVVKNRSVSELMEVLGRMIAAGALVADTGGGSSNAVSGISPAPLPTGNGPYVNPVIVAPTATPAPLLPTGYGQPNSRTPGTGVAGNAALPITLTADEATNTIIAIGEARLLTQLEMLLKALDVRQPQVMLEVVLVTLSDRDSQSLGLELQKVGSSGGISSTVSSLFGLSTLVGAGPTAALAPTAAAGFTGAVISPGDYSVIIKAIESLGGGRAVSLPKVLVSNNQRSQFDSLVQEPYGVSFTQGNSNSTSVTFGGTLDAGTKLSIKPQIGQADSVLLDYSISISSFGEQGRAGNLPPSRQVNSLQSLATVPDGHTVIVGGMETQNDSKSADQLPILGDLPIIGNVFKNQSRSNSRSRFFVFIRASVMRGQSLEALRHLSAEATSQADVPTGWPQSEPQVIK
jgi:general secretion pathway protein D